MKEISTTIALFVASLTATFILAACTAPKVEDPVLQPVQQQQQNGQTQQSDQAQAQTTLPPTPSASTSTQPTEEVVNQQLPNLTQDVQKGPQMKTLADFAKITASEATIKTNKGDITFTLYADKEPLTVTNFLTLAKSGFYDGIKFHRIIPDFMAQVGDPLTKDDSQKAAWGTGGPGYTIQDEFDPSLKHDSEGIVSMANTGQPNTGGSQFFITYAATPWLDGKHPIFGKVTSGMDVLKNLVIGDQIISISYK